MCGVLLCWWYYICVVCYDASVVCSVLCAIMLEVLYDGAGVVCDGAGVV